MKRTLYILSVVLPAALLFSMVDATAQRRNTTSHDVKPVQQVEEMARDVKHKSEKMEKKHHKDDKKMKDCKCKKDKKCDCMKKKDDKHKDKKHQKFSSNEEITENYNKAVERINKSDFNAKQKAFLLKQAQDSRDFAIQQNEARQKLLQTQMADRQNFGITKDNLKDNKANKKAVKKISKILFD